MKIFAIVLIVVLPVVLTAQESANASGGNIEESEKGSVSYSVGQIVYTQNTGSNGSLAQGVQQPYEISVISGMEETGISLEFSVFPNPATDYLNLIIRDAIHKNLKYSLYTMKGKILANGEVTDKITKIDITPFAPSAYLLHVSNNQSRIKTFKILKR